MAETTNYQCPNCNGRLSFDGSVGKLKCEFCESEFTPEEVEAIYAERQAKADGRAAGDRSAQAAGEMGAVPQLTAEQIAQFQVEQQRIIQEGSEAGKSQEEINAEIDAMRERIAGVAGAAPVTPTPTAAQASETGVAHVEVRGPEEGEDPIDTYLRNAKWDDLDEANLRSYNCPSCGAQLMVDQVTAVTSCPYCGNNAVVPGQLSDILKPDYVIPFRFDKQAAIDALKGYYQGKRLLPNDFSDQNHIEEIQGVYVPFWLYSGEAEGDATFNARNIRTWSDSENNYVETDHYIVHRSGKMSFTRVPVDGSTKMPDAHMDAIEPFDYNEMEPFSVAYLPGFLTDRYDQGAKTCEKRANTRVANTCADKLRDTVTGYAEVDVASNSALMHLDDVAYALLPVWMLHTRWNDQDFLFAMNGQTGKLVGDLPIDKGKQIRMFLLIFLPLVIICAIIAYFFVLS